MAKAPTKRPRNGRPQTQQPAMSAVALVDAFMERLNERVQQQAGTIASGGCGSHEEYLRSTAFLKGIQFAQMELQAVLKGEYPDDDSSELPEMPNA